METQKLSFEDFKNIIVERLGCEPEQVTMDASFQEDLNADSLDLVELIYAFEENTGLEIPDEDAEKITTVGQAWEYIQEKTGLSLHRSLSLCSSSSKRSGFTFATLASCWRRSRTAPSPTRPRRSRRETTNVSSTWATPSSS